MQRFISYRRVSTAEQANEGHSLDAQALAIAKHVSLMGGEVAFDISDEGLSGGNCDRPGLQKALALIADGDADGLVVTKLDRLSRSTIDLLTIVRDYFPNDSGARLVIMDLGVDTHNPAGKLVLNVMAALAEFELNQIKHRTKEALGYLKAQNKRYSGRAPYGMRFVKGKIVPDSSEAEILERAIALANETRDDGVASLSFGDIANTLKAEGYRNREGKPFTRQGIRNLVYSRDAERQKEIRRRGRMPKARP